MCGMQADLRAIVMDRARATAGLLLILDGPADPLWRASMHVCVCDSAVQSVNDKEENDVMGGERVSDTGDERGKERHREAGRGDSKGFHHFKCCHRSLINHFLNSLVMYFCCKKLS